jgi:hypothetical protein
MNQNPEVKCVKLKVNIALHRERLAGLLAENGFSVSVETALPNPNRLSSTQDYYIVIHDGPAIIEHLPPKPLREG